MIRKREDGARRRRPVRTVLIGLGVAALGAGFAIGPVTWGAGVAVAADDPPATSPVVTAVTRSPGSVDVFGVDTGQRIYTASWTPQEVDGWQRSAQLLGGTAAKGTSVYGVSRYTNRMDVFAVGADRKVWTALWESPGAGRPGQWRGWWQVGDLKVRAGTSVHAVTSHRDRMDLFAIGDNGQVQTITWTAQGEWGAWTPLPGINPAEGSMAFAVSGARFTNSLDVFAVHATGNWSPSHNSYDPATGWSGWQRINKVAGGDAAARGSSVFPVSRNFGTIDIFYQRQYGGISTASWTSLEGWSPISQIGTGNARWGSTVFATVRAQRTIDAVAVGPAGDVHVASMGTDRRWSAWKNIGPRVLAGTDVFIHPRGSQNLEVFAVKPDYGSYAASWNPTAGWGAWQGIGPRGQAGTYREVETAVELDDRTVAGWSKLRVFSGGAYRFHGGLVNTGRTNRNVNFAWVITLPSGTAFTFDMSKKINGSVSGGSNSHSWDETGAGNDIAAAWPEIERLSTWEWRASESIDKTDLILQIITGIGIIDRIINF